MNFNEIDENDYTRKTFGCCIRTQREECGISVRNCAKILGMSPVYLSDIERGNRNAPYDYIEKIIDILDIPDNQRKAVYKMAKASYGYKAYRNYLENNQTEITKFLRIAQETDLTATDWEVIFNTLDNIKQTKTTNKALAKKKTK